MAHFAQLDENNVVLQVIVVNNNDLLVAGIENEDRGITFCKNLLGQDTNWKQTSYNGNFRYNYAGIGYTYDPVRDGFVPPQPYPSWQLADNCTWWAPTPMPNDDKRYRWDEPTTSWVEVQGA
jgi:hypothetical protein